LIDADLIYSTTPDNTRVARYEHHDSVDSVDDELALNSQDTFPKTNGLTFLEKWDRVQQYLRDNDCELAQDYQDADNDGDAETSGIMEDEQHTHTQLDAENTEVEDALAAEIEDAEDAEVKYTEVKNAVDPETGDAEVEDSEIEDAADAEPDDAEDAKIEDVEDAQTEDAVDIDTKD
jgi:hypothetical protein